MSGWQELMPVHHAPITPTDLLLDEGFILLGFATFFVLLFRRLGLGAVLGYLVAGALVGPQVLGLVGGGQTKLDIAEIGIVLLMFIIGLELNPARLWRLKRDIFALGLAQVVLSGVALATIIYYGTAFSTGAAIALGLPLALSSTAQVLPGLKNSGRINSPFGEKAFSILLFQDLSIVPLITIVAALSRNPADAGGPPGWLLVLYTIGAIGGLGLAGRFILRPVLQLVGTMGERELFVVVGLFTVIASALLMHSLGLSTALGAFVAGVLLADSPYRHEIESDIEPFRSILLGLFFLAVGMVLDIRAVLANPLFVLSMALLVVAVKVLILWGLAMLFGMRGKAALGLGLLLSQGGEFGFVLFAQARDALLIAPQAASMFNAVVTLSMATTPFLMLFARRLEFARPSADRFETPEVAARGTAIIVGYGRFGQTVAQMLMGHGFAVTMIDRKPAQIQLSDQFDMKVYYGDGTRVELLRSAGADEARLIAFCIDDPALDAPVLEHVKEAFPNAAIVVRVFDRRHMIRLHGINLGGVIRELFESAIAMGRLSMQLLGVKPEEIAEVEQQYRENDRTRFEVQLKEGDLFAAKHLMYRPGRTMNLRSREQSGEGE
ncbi:potassium efflux system protein [Sphingobium jiangsuense]|uniref:CPA2 family monovalent cation:H+ antiporter-2 n=2 Tax=Sphingobium jiangsuense TaxID=870476 RepID=A0A7W6FPX5_9SPHN|nr:cation:proton antiporter [Sphingobium jiangsuense]MBB3926323.1 CPA2 family monovalent cation:H+ antiporter-2 [Sphingobium jiangsuense]GLS99705.1 potassium efflux system protein [Sphingobium jiangsuense]